MNGKHYLWAAVALIALLVFAVNTRYEYMAAGRGDISTKRIDHWTGVVEYYNYQTGGWDEFSDFGR